jgi:hypothetical protein
MVIYNVTTFHQKPIGITQFHYLGYLLVCMVISNFSINSITFSKNPDKETIANVEVIQDSF